MNGRRIATRVVLGIAGIYAAAAIVVACSGSRADDGTADAAIVLGYGLAHDGTMKPELVARVVRAESLFERGIVRKVVVTGGVPRGGITEAAAMRARLLADGIPDAAILRDERARSTVENFACVKPLLEAIGAHDAFVVTSPWHEPRAILLARRDGLDVRRAPAAWTDRLPVLRETLAFLEEIARSPFARPGTCPR